MAGAVSAAKTGDQPGSGPGLRAVADPPSGERTRRSGCDRLSRKERLVLGELALGNSTEEIGVALGVSPHTVRTHVKNLMRKLGARTRAHAVAIALSERAIEMRS
jgi:DNA-binding CsgD family transcriptional regulator